jgi:hypothetical protein
MIETQLGNTKRQKQNQRLEQLPLLSQQTTLPLLSL